MLPCLAAAFLAVCGVGAAWCRDVTFAWTANDGAVDGYRLHYSSGGGPPYDGAGAAEGASPVDVGNVTSFTLHGLSDRKAYVFALTAYAGTQQSDYSAKIVLPRVNAAPTADAGRFSVREGVVHIGRLSGSDAEGDPLTFVVVGDGAKGRVVLHSSASGDFTYTPFANAAGTDAFTFRVSDGISSSAVATVTVTIIR